MDIEKLITVKRLEIEKEKMLLGLAPMLPDSIQESKENVVDSSKPKQVNFVQNKVLGDHNERERESKEEGHSKISLEEENISPDLERYIRRYLGLPVMLKAGEFSPNNPLIRGERVSGDVLLGLGEYERRRNTLRKIQQKQYREYLDQQAKKKQEAKEQAERERRERDERERQLREEREKEYADRDTKSPDRRASLGYVPSAVKNYHGKVDTGVQVSSVNRPLSVAVQTDDADLCDLSTAPCDRALTQAERELSPHTVAESRAAPCYPDTPPPSYRRRSCTDWDERSSSVVKKSNREKLVSDLRHTYMPTIFDADAIHLRNMQAEKDAAARRQFYQQELKNQILEQQRIREERKAREKMLEQAEMRRLEEQLRMLKAAQESEVDKHHDLSYMMKEKTSDFAKKRSALQREIDLEQRELLLAQPIRHHNKTSTSDTLQNRSKLPFYYPKIHQRSNEICTQKPPFSMNIPDNSIFSSNYDVDSYLRKNLNPSKETLLSSRLSESRDKDVDDVCERNTIVEKALVHECPKKKCERNKTEDSLPIPILRHSPGNETKTEEKSNLSTAMQVVDDKWKVPAVQKNILKSMPNEEGRNVNILTQLGSIRRQLQLEQLKLDKMLSKDDV